MKVNDPYFFHKELNEDILFRHGYKVLSWDPVILHNLKTGSELKASKATQVLKKHAIGDAFTVPQYDRK